MIDTHRARFFDGRPGANPDAVGLGDHLALDLVADHDGADELWALQRDVPEASRSEWTFATDVRFPDDEDGTRRDSHGATALPRRMWLWKVRVPLHERSLMAELIELIHRHGGSGPLGKALPTRVRGALMAPVSGG